MLPQNQRAIFNGAGCALPAIAVVLVILSLIVTGCTTSRTLGVYDDDAAVIRQIAERSRLGTTYVRARDSPAWTRVRNLRLLEDSLTLVAEGLPARRVDKRFNRNMRTVSNGTPILLPINTLGRISVTRVDNGKGFWDGFTPGAATGGILGGLMGAALANTCIGGRCPAASAIEHLSGLIGGGAIGALVFGVPLGLIGAAIGHRDTTLYGFRERPTNSQ